MTSCYYCCLKFIITVMKLTRSHLVCCQLMLRWGLWLADQLWTGVAAGRRPAEVHHLYSDYFSSKVLLLTVSASLPLFWLLLWTRFILWFIVVSLQLHVFEYFLTQYFKVYLYIFIYIYSFYGFVLFFIFCVSLINLYNHFLIVVFFYTAVFFIHVFLL